MYNNVKACIKCNNGTRSKNITRSIRLKHGCFASPVFFSLYIDELVDILHNSDIRGKQLHAELKEVLILLFADGIAMLSDNVY